MPSDADSTRTRPVLAAGIVFAVLALDLVTKTWAVRELADGPVEIVGSTVDLRLARNTGGAFSLFPTFTPVLAIVAGVVTYFLVRTVRRTHDTLLLVALSLVLGGAVGNLLDRVFRSPGFLRGAVIDFVHIGEWPTFNVADSAITIGAILVVFWSVRTTARERRAGAHEQSAREQSAQEQAAREQPAREQPDG